MSALIELVERMTRPGLLGLVGKTIEKRCRQDLQSYFRLLGRRVVALELENLATGDNLALAQHTVEMKLHNVLRVLRPLLTSTLELHLQDALLAGNNVHHFAEATQPIPPDPILPPPPGGGDDEIDRLGLSGREASKWAEDHAAKLVLGIDETTAELIARAISIGIEEQLGVDGTARLIRQVLQDMSVDRARMIALTEINAAMSEAGLEKLKRLGIEYKQWILGPNPCETCEGNAEEGAILVDDDFPSGDARPPAHPNCGCAVTGARAPQDDN